MNSNTPGSPSQEVLSPSQEVLGLHGDPEAIPDSVLLASVPVGVLTYQADGRCTSANEAAAEVLGVSRDRLLEQNFRTLSSWRDSGLLAHAEATLQHDHPFDGRLSVTTTSGRDLCLEWRLRRIDLDTAAALLVVFEDVTERDRAEKALRLTQLSVDKSADLIHWVNAAGRIIYVSDSTCQRHGYSREELLKMTIFDLEPTMTPELWAERWISYKDGGSHTIETVHKTKRGDLFPSELTLNYVESDGITYQFAYARDITNRVGMEESLRLTQFSVDRALDYVYWLNSKGGFVFASEAACRRLGYSLEELLTMTIFDVDPQAPRDWSEHFRDIKKHGSFTFERVHMTKAGETFPVEVTVNYVEFNGKEYDFVSARDVTERKRAEEELRRSHDLLNITGQLAKVGGWELIPETQALTWTEEVYRIHEVDPDTSPTFTEAISLYAPEAQPVISAAVQAAIETGAPFDLELPLITARGRHIWVRAQGAVERRDGKTVRLHGALQDITGRRQAEEALRASEERYRKLFDYAPDGILVADSEGYHIDANASMCRMLGYTHDELIGPALSVIKAKSNHVREWRLRRKDGSFFAAEVNATTMPDGNLLAMVHDITERKRAEEVLRESEESLRALFDTMTSGCAIYEVRNDGSSGGDYIVKDFNASSLAIEGKTKEEVVGKSLLELRPTIDEYGLISVFQKVWQSGEPSFFPASMYVDENFARWYENRVFKMPTGEIVALYDDVTDRKQAEEALRRRLVELETLHTVSGLLRTAQTGDEAVPIVLDEMLAALETDAGALWLYDADSHELRSAASRGWLESITMTPSRPGEALVGTVFTNGQTHVSVELASDPLIRPQSRSLTPAGWGGVCAPIRTGEITIGVLLVAVPPAHTLTPHHVSLLESLAGMAGAALHRMTLYEGTVRQLDRLQAMHLVDQAISSSTDLRVALDLLLEHVAVQLEVDAADVLLLNPHTLTLEYGAGRGFRITAATGAPIRLGESLAGLAALERRMVHVDGPVQGHESPRLTALQGVEGFVAYRAVSLVAKGQVIGVLEVFHRAPLSAGQDWLDLLETLAGQTAVAIENAQLFEGMQRSNLDLALAYDATIEGWSRAVDLRDKETEGHTQRVTEMTMRLARAMGIADAELLHVRRGALLHDIGKLGVPDDILLKPGPLSEGEWVSMRRHPQLAYDLLAPITYLRPALDIPLYHHERWDGTGYPRGLKGEEIPLVARLFAVVDVWDALRSDRPYRERWWPEEKVHAHIRSSAGTHFDPQVVEVFFRVVGEKAEKL